MIFDEIKEYCPAHNICRANGNFAERTCKYSNNPERKLTMQCAAGIVTLLSKLLEVTKSGK